MIATIMSPSPANSFRIPWTAYFAAISASVVSSMRLQKPHSLSYQAQHLDQVAFHHPGQGGVVDRGARVVVEVDRHQRLRC